MSKGLRFFILATGILLFTSFMARAQFHFGPRLSVGMSQYHVEKDNLEGYKRTRTSRNVFSYQAGIAVSYEFGLGVGSLEIESGVHYASLGGTIHWHNSLGREEYRVRFGYIDIPVRLLFNYQFRVLGLYVGIGPQFGFAVNGSHTSIWKDYRGKVSEEVNKKLNFGNTESDDFKSSNVMLSLHGGVSLFRKFRFGVYWDYGLNNIYPDWHSKSDRFSLSAYGLTCTYRIL